MRLMKGVERDSRLTKQTIMRELRADLAIIPNSRRKGMNKRYREWNFEEDEKEYGFVSAFFKGALLVVLFWSVMIMSAAFI